MSPLKLAERRRRLCPNGIPRYVHCYDNGGTSFDQYTIVFTGRYRHKTLGETFYRGCSKNPYHPCGIGQSGSSPDRIDWPTYGHLGKKIRFYELPPDVRKLVLDDYAELWDLGDPSALTQLPRQTQADTRSP